ncbi:MAG: DUF2177 family protein [Hyphomicrobiaceae bacterium]|nr:DUF2177 family protein [Hyphomicrobiaceae bacterium]
MMGYLAPYVAALVVFAVVDGAWLYFMGSQLYKPTLGDILTPDVRLGPAAAFYLLFPVGLTIFAIDPAIKAGSIGTALLYGALFGFFAYATYDLTNFATLRNWTLQITLIDMAYGAAVAALASAAGYWASTLTR